jgi:putative ABC transport system permease protein
MRKYLKLFKEGFLFAVNSVVVNKLRTFLSLFGITIGIFSIISVFTVLDWMEKSIRDAISSMGDNVVYVEKFPWSFDPNLAWWDIIKWPAISLKDYEAVQRKSEKARSECLIIYHSASIKYKKNQADRAQIWAPTYEWTEIRSFELEEGRYFTPEESASGKNVAILGSKVAEELFDKSDPVGKQITIAGKKVNIIGIFKREGKGGISDSGLDEITVIPLNFGRTFINMRNNFLQTSLMIEAKQGVSTQELTDETMMILRAARRLQPEEISNFSINQSALITQGFEPVFAGINIAGWLIGGFSILVGGFGIANIMFVSVRERTNIIGIQKALGAKRSFILQQFLVESVLLSVIGGLLGVFLIFLGSIVINYLWELNMYLTLGNIVLAVVISGVIGIVAGYAPAYAAAKMDPVEAIGYSFG